MMMKRTIRTAGLAAFLLLGGLPPASIHGTSRAQDSLLATGKTKLFVYVLYSAKEKKMLRSIQKAFPSGTKLKGYNTRVLALVDYSGKQKAVARFNKSDLVVILGPKAIKAVAKGSFSTPVLIVNTTLANIDSKKGIVHIVSLGTDIKKLGKSAKKLEFKAKTKLTAKKLDGVDVVLADKKTLPAAVAEVALAISGNKKP
jgi:hypothetical protein